MSFGKYTDFERVTDYPDKPIYKLDMKEFHPLITLKKRLEYFDTLDLSKVGYKKIRGMLFELVHGIELKTPAINAPPTIFRGRNFIPEKEDITNKSQFWYPEKKYVTKRGRVNKKDEVIFYGSTSFHSIFSELSINIGDFLVIAELNLINPKHDDKLIQLGFTQNILRELGIPEEKIDQTTSVERELFPSRLKIDDISISDQSESYLFLDFFSKYMAMKRKDTNFYKITNAISETWFSDERIAGITYPNIDTNYYDNEDILLGYNIAMKPLVVDKLYNVKKIWVLKLHNRDSTKLQLQVIKSSVSLDKNESIIWKEEPYSTELPIDSRKVEVDAM